MSYFVDLDGSFFVVQQPMILSFPAWSVQIDTLHLLPAYIGMKTVTSMVLITLSIFTSTLKVIMNKSRLEQMNTFEIILLPDRG